MLKEEMEIVPFKYENKLQVCDILKKTKHLIKSTKKYINYMQRYTNITQTTTFKLPDITSYPILKNNELIPLNRTTFDFFRPTTSTTRDANIFQQGTNYTNSNPNLPKRPQTETGQKHNILISSPDNLQVLDLNIKTNEEGNILNTKDNKIGLNFFNDETINDKIVLKINNTEEVNEAHLQLKLANNFDDKCENDEKNEEKLKNFNTITEANKTAENFYSTSLLQQNKQNIRISGRFNSFEKKSAEKISKFKDLREIINDIILVVARRL